MRDKNYNPESVQASINIFNDMLNDDQYKAKGEQFIKDVKYAIHLLTEYQKENS